MLDLLTLGTFLLMLMWIVTGAYWIRQQISDMSAMMLAMGTGMIAGVSIGTLLILLYPDLFFKMTVFSMLTAGIIGFFTGLSKSNIASIDGMLSGFMGGMMGTMLGLMVEPEYSIYLLKIIGIISAGSLFMLWISIYPDLGQQEKQKKRFSFSPSLLIQQVSNTLRRFTKEFRFSHVSLFIFVCIFYYLLIQAPLAYLPAQHESMKHALNDQHMEVHSS